MSNYLAHRIEKPDYFKIAPLKKGRPARRPFIIGFDSEAERGAPFLYQFAYPDGSVDLIDVEKKRYRPFAMFCEWVFDNCKRKDLDYVIFGFNLSYEWTQLFGDLSPIARTEDEIKVRMTLANRGDVTLIASATNSKRYFMTIEIGGTKRRVKVIDARAYFVTSLDQAAKIIGAGAKLPKPKEFSRKAARTEAFKDYAKQDAILTQKLGEYIIAWHEKYDVATCVSAPHFAASTFRRHYLKTEIPLPPEELEQYGLFAYHGGKNGYYLDGPKLLKRIYKYDIRSAYPEAMRQLPNIEDGEWYRAERYHPGTHSVWRVNVRYSGCHFRAMQNINGTWFEQSADFDTFATGYEIDAALELGEFEIISADGYIFDGPSGGPLVNYVDDFYAQKRHAKTDTEKLAAKLFLNSLYGKFFQKVPYAPQIESWELTEEPKFIQTDSTLEYDYRAGGLYHPPIAALITGYVRAKIHLLEHKYRAIMTSTDGIFAYQEPDSNDIGDELGMLDVEIGTLRIWRERLYVFTPTKGKIVAAFHGFRGKLEQLKRMPLSKGLVFEYQATQLITLRMADKKIRGNSSHRPGEIIPLTFVMDLSKSQPP